MVHEVAVVLDEEAEAAEALHLAVDSQEAEVRQVVGEQGTN